MEFEEIYKFIDKISRLWNFNVITVKHSEKELEEFHRTKDPEKKRELSRLMKITAINHALKKYKLRVFMAGIRWDEHESRSKEKYFSPRADHMRIHPLLHFTEKDIWEYIRFFGVPYVELYDKGYRSLGEKPFTKPVSPGGNERSGREREKEQLMERLRKLGYW
jgi:phosphoadenosine phosphosulfate reductase